MLVPTQSGRLHLGVDLGGTKMLVAAYTTLGRRVWSFRTGPETDRDVIRRNIAQVLKELDSNKPDAIGVAVPGLVDHSGVVTDSDVLPGLVGWRPEDDWPGAAVLNDGEAALVSVAAGERDDATVAAVGCGTGIVAAIQVAGRRLRQSRPYSGELGLAPCGMTATFDDVASGAALVRALEIAPQEIHARLEQGDARCLAAIREAGEAFGLCLVTLLHLVHPEKIGLYGGTLRYPGYLNAALAVLHRRAHPLMLRLCRVEPVPEPETVVAEGALRLALRQ